MRSKVPFMPKNVGRISSKNRNWTDKKKTKLNDMSIKPIVKNSDSPPFYLHTRIAYEIFLNVGGLGST
jgi:hypothetical protein